MFLQISPTAFLIYNYIYNKSKNNIGINFKINKYYLRKYLHVEYISTLKALRELTAKRLLMLDDEFIVTYFTTDTPIKILIGELLKTQNSTLIFKSLKPLSKAILCEIASFSWQDKPYIKSTTILSKRFRVSERAVRKSKQQLCSHNFITNKSSSKTYFKQLWFNYSTIQIRAKDKIIYKKIIKLETQQTEVKRAIIDIFSGKVLSN